MQHLTPPGKADATTNTMTARYFGVCQRQIFSKYILLTFSVRGIYIVTFYPLLDEADKLLIPILLSRHNIHVYQT